MHFMACTDQPLLRIQALQMLHNNAATSEMGQGYWECLRVGATHTRGTREKDRKIRRSSTQFLFAELWTDFKFITKFHISSHPLSV